jgi:hypothetical protein
MEKNMRESYDVNVGLRQGDKMSAILFNLVM